MENRHRCILLLIWAVHKSYSFFCKNQILAINFLWGLQLKLDPPTDKKATQICQDRTPTRLVWPKILAVKESQSSWSQQAAHSKRKTSATSSGASLTSGRGLGQDGARRGEPAGGGHLFHFPVFLIPATRGQDKKPWLSLDVQERRNCPTWRQLLPCWARWFWMQVSWDGFVSFCNQQGVCVGQSCLSKEIHN